jgi:hypothetical protein
LDEKTTIEESGEPNKKLAKIIKALEEDNASLKSQLHDYDAVLLDKTKTYN